MCGICGVVGGHLESEELRNVLSRMVATLQHRGPDGQDGRLFLHPRLPKPVALGHTRLAIIDLSEAGRQPLSNEDGTVWIVFNGEIFNFQELRNELEEQGHQFRSRTDTEVIVHLYEEYGPTCVERLNGMFAFAILDFRSQRLLLARDPIGIKPLYYWSTSETFLFGSEIKSILASSLYSTDVNWQAAYDYLTYLYVPSPQTIFRGIAQLPPAHRLILDLSSGESRLERYWHIRRMEDVEKASAEDLRQRVRHLASDSVKRQLVSDVPLGVFLSGGVDSTIVTGLAREEKAELHTYTVVFEGEEFAYYNEQETSLAISQHLGTRHKEIRVPSSDPTEIFDLVEFFDQPFGNPTFYLMHLICRHAREHISVALCGAGGDELYAGYPRYRAAQLARRLGGIPKPVLRLGKKVLGFWHDSYRTMGLRRARKFLDGLDEDFFRQFVRWTYFLDGPAKNNLLRKHGEGQIGYAPSDRVVRAAAAHSELGEFENRILQADVETFLLDNILEYTDKMSMAVGLEVRVPLLDQRFVELSLNIPFSHKLRRNQTKSLLRETFSDFFPAVARKAPKRGFNVPLGIWVRQFFDDYFEENPRSNGRLKRLRSDDVGASWREGIFDKQVIDQLREEHRRGIRDNSYELFSILMFDVWWCKYVRNPFPVNRVPMMRVN